jgi:REP element-mobilizing transposase RayT
MKDDFVSSGRSVSDMKAHLVLTTKYRRKVLTGEMIQPPPALVRQRTSTHAPFIPTLTWVQRGASRLGAK